MERLIEVFKSKAAIAKIAKVTAPAVGTWFKNNRVPAEQVLNLEACSNGELHCSEIRPDIYPPDRFKSV